MWDWLTGNGEKLKETVSFLQEYKDYLQFQDIVGWLGNVISWGYIRLVYTFNTGLEKVLLNSFDVADFLKHQGLTDLQSQFVSTLGFILLVISAILIGIRMMISKNPPKLKDTLVNIVVAVFLLLFSGSVINDLFSVSKQGFMDITQIENQSPSIQLVQDNTTDLIQVLKKGTKNIKDDDKLNAITKKNFPYTDMSSVVTPDDLEDVKTATKNDNALLLDKVLSVNDDGEITAVSYKDNWISQKIAPSGYRRYASNRSVIAVGETALIFAYFYIIFTVIMCIFELAFKKFYLLVAVSTDLDTGQRRNKALQSIGNSLLLIAFTGLELNIYLKILDYIGHANLGSFVYIISLCCATILLYKGSNAVSELFGVDTSLKNGAGSLMATMATLGIVKGVGKGVAKGTGFVTKKGLSAIRNKGGNEKGDTTNSKDNSKIPTRSDVENDGNSSAENPKKQPSFFKNKEANSNEEKTDLNDTTIPGATNKNEDSLGSETESNRKAPTLVNDDGTEDTKPTVPTNDNDTSLETESKSAEQKQELTLDKEQEQKESTGSKFHVPTRDTDNLLSEGDKQKATQTKELELESNQEMNQTGKTTNLAPSRETDSLNVSDSGKLATATEKVGREIEREVKSNTTSTILDSSASSPDLSKMTSNNHSTTISDNSVEHATVESKTQTKVTKKLDFGDAPELSEAGKKLKSQRDAKVKKLMDNNKRN